VQKQCPFAAFKALFLVLLSAGYGTHTLADQAAVAESVEVSILSSNLASGATVGEWGFSAFVQVDEHCVLFDAGRYPDTVVRNAKALKTDLSCVTDVVLSHFHFDHTSGLITLIDDLRTRNPDAIQRIHVAEGFFRSRRIASMSGDDEWNPMIAMRTELEAKGIEFLIYDRPTEVLPAVWVTGPVERAHQEKTYSTSVEMKADDQWVTDFVPDSQGMTVVTEEGPIVLLGCGHSGSVNLLEQVQRDIQNRPIHALMGGMHLFSATEETLLWTSDRLREIGVQNLMAGHCTGIEPLMYLRSGLGLDRSSAVVGAVGSRFVLGEGIHATAIAR
jgi:7,8-dihydropterin-6-yl-methyl-4-(beta-D-ribofuranosyl)aminobenzene 5'-phosphate synthase